MPLTLDLLLEHQQRVSLQQLLSPQTRRELILVRQTIFMYVPTVGIHVNEVRDCCVIARCSRTSRIPAIFVRTTATTFPPMQSLYLFCTSTRTLKKLLLQGMEPKPTRPILALPPGSRCRLGLFGEFAIHVTPNSPRKVRTAANLCTGA
jgi:hypothetical protein